MKNIFQKSKFPVAPGGNLYDWQEAKTEFEVKRDGVYIIGVTASAQNGQQNSTGDDDDLRMALNGYLFGREERHQKKTSWHSFGVAAAWDGASLKGGEKTVHFFTELKKGKHFLTFRADGKPVLKKIEIIKLDQKGDTLEDAIFGPPETAPSIKVDKNGIPWKSFIFQSQFNTQPFRIRLAEITATCRSATQKSGTDGDNVKVYVNGRIVPNPKALTSKKYKNFFFSGDQMQGQTESLMIPGDLFTFSESGDFSIELWYDETPILERVKFEIESGSEYDRTTWIERRKSDFAEWEKLPKWNIKVHPLKIRKTVSGSWDRTIRYADQHGFFTIDASGNKKRNTIDNEADAFRHFTWSVLLTHEFNGDAARLITTNHEIFWLQSQNKKDFTREAIMDLWNNKMGRQYAEKYPNTSPEELFQLALSQKVIVRRLEEVTEEKRNSILEEVNPYL